MQRTFLGFTFGKPDPITQDTEHTFKSMGFSTPFGKVGSGNLSLPYINKYYTQNGIVKFGTDNLYPQLLNQLYYTSAIHGACIDFIAQAVSGGGYSWEQDKLTIREEVDRKAFEKTNKFQKMIGLITKDFVIHRRVCVLVTKRSGKVIKLKRIDPSGVRNYLSLEKFEYSPDWSRGTVDAKTYDRYESDKPDGTYLYVYQDETPGQDIYPIPTYNSILNWAFDDGEQAFFHKSNAQNSVFPSIAIRRPKEFDSLDEINLFKEGIRKSKGAENAGNVIVLTGNGMDDVPEIVQINANNNDKLFEGTSKELKENIAIAHKINVAIIGIKVAGSLGNSEELEMSYSIFEKIVVMPLRLIIEEIANDLVDIVGLNQTLKLNDYQIIDKVIVPGEVEASEDTKDGKVAVPGTKVVVEPDPVNDALKGLSAAENADIYRICRDHAKGKLNDALALTRLRSYGISEENAKEILDIK